MSFVEKRCVPVVDDMRVYIANLGKYNEGELIPYRDFL